MSLPSTLMIANFPGVHNVVSLARLLMSAHISAMTLWSAIDQIQGIQRRSCYHAMAMTFRL